MPLTVVNPGVEGVGAVLNVEGELEDVKITGTDDLHWQSVINDPSVSHRHVECVGSIILIHTDQRFRDH